MKLFNTLKNFLALSAVIMIVLGNTPNMNLPNPTPGVTPGPQWATDISNSLNLIDAHQHVPGQGKQVPTAGININQDLPLNLHNATNARAYKMASNSSPLPSTDAGAIYRVGIDIWLNNGNGYPIQLSNGTHLNIGPSSGGFGGDYISAGALASYNTVGNIYKFMAPASANANLQCSANFSALGTATITGATSSGSPLSVTGNTPSLQLFDSDTSSIDYQIQANNNVTTLSADTNNDGIFDIQNLFYFDSNYHAAVGGAVPLSQVGPPLWLPANFTVGNGNTSTQSIQLGVSPTASNNFHIVNTPGGGNQSLSIYSGNYGNGTLLMQMNATGQVTFNGGANPSRGFAYFTPNEIAFALSYSNDYNGRNYFSALKSRGTQGAPTPVQPGDILGGFSAGGFNGSDWFADVAGMRSVATAVWDGTQNDAQLKFWVTPVESQTPVDVVTIDGGGNLLPTTDNTQDVGSSSVSWNDAWFDGTVNAASANISGGSATGMTSVSSGTFTSTNAYLFDSQNIQQTQFSTAGYQCLSGSSCTNNNNLTVLLTQNSYMLIPLSVPYDDSGSVAVNIGGGFTSFYSSNVGNQVTAQLYRTSTTIGAAGAPVAVTPLVTQNFGSGPSTLVWGGAYNAGENVVHLGSYFLKIGCTSTISGCQIGNSAINILFNGMPRVMLK